MAATNQTDDLSIKRMGTTMRNMGLASLLALVIPAIGLWYFYLAGQLAIAARDADKANNMKELQKVKKITTANLIVSGTFFLIVVGSWMMALLLLSVAMGGGGGGTSTTTTYFQTLIWGCGGCAVGWGITSSCLNIMLWNTLMQYFKTGGFGSAQDLGSKGCKAGLFGSAIGLIAWVIGIPTAIMASIFITAIGTTPHPSSETVALIVLSLLVLLTIAVLHGVASICTHVTGLFKTGSALQEIGASGTGTRTSGLTAMQTTGSTRIIPTPRVLFDAATVVPNPVFDATTRQDAGVVNDGDLAPAQVPNNSHQETTSQLATTHTPLQAQNPNITKLLPRFCPLCGNPLAINPVTSQCEYCGENIVLK